MSNTTTYLSAFVAFFLVDVEAFSTRISRSQRSCISLIHLRASSWGNDNNPVQDSANAWINGGSESGIIFDDDWETTLKRKDDGSFWSDFELEQQPSGYDTTIKPEKEESEKMLDRLTSIQAEEVSFNVQEAKRADTQRQMEEWGFDSSTIASALNVAVEERQEEVQGMNDYLEDAYWQEDDLTTIESHKKVPKDPITNNPIRSQMVYVDEHACIGCTK